MKIEEVIGILVISCEHCGKKFVPNTENIKSGFQCICDCGRHHNAMVGTRLQVSLTDGVPYYNMSKESQRDHGRILKQCYAMPVDDYKARLAEKILGKKPKVPTQHKGVISFDDNNVNVVVIVKTLQTLGFNEKEAMEKIDIAVKDGFFHEEEIIKYILSLK